MGLLFIQPHSCIFRLWIYVRTGFSLYFDLVKRNRGKKIYLCLPLESREMERSMKKILIMFITAFFCMVFSTNVFAEDYQIFEGGNSTGDLFEPNIGCFVVVYAGLMVSIYDT